jgi:hypothetical protein
MDYTAESLEMLVWLIGSVAVSFFVISIGYLLAAIIERVGYKGNVR